jgi:hypothetical protein
MTGVRASPQIFLGVSALLFTGSAALTRCGCRAAGRCRRHGSDSQDKRGSKSLGRSSLRGAYPVEGISPVLLPECPGVSPNTARRCWHSLAAGPSLWTSLRPELRQSDSDSSGHRNHGFVVLWPLSWPRSPLNASLHPPSDSRAPLGSYLLGLGAGDPWSGKTWLRQCHRRRWRVVLESEHSCVTGRMRLILPPSLGRSVR